MGTGVDGDKAASLIWHLVQHIHTGRFMKVRQTRRTARRIGHGNVLRWRCLDCGVYTNSFIHEGAVMRPCCKGCLGMTPEVPSVPSWVMDASCAGTPPPDPPAQLWTRRFCVMCPVSDECAVFGLDDKHSIYGGLTPKERRGLDERSVVKASRSKLAHLTPAGGRYERLDFDEGLAVAQKRRARPRVAVQPSIPEQERTIRIRLIREAS